MHYWKQAAMLFAFAISFGSVTSCDTDTDDEVTTRTFGFRDGNYAGNRLNILMDGVKQTAKSVDVYSIVHSKPSTQTDGTYHLEAVYEMTVTINGFPSSKEKLVLKTTMDDYTTFEGTTVINNKNYRYNGTFSGTPLDAPTNQGLTIEFTTV